jgi:glycosyltransferase involved in cell wall biosynthesis
MSSVCVVIPAYNEEKNISQVVESLRSADATWLLVVVNDGSTDQTETVAREAEGATVLSLPCNLGIGGSVQTGLKYAMRQNAGIAVQFDGDGQHIATEIPKLLAPILEGKADAVIGSRFLIPDATGFRSTWARRMGIKIFEWMCQILIQKKITDCTSGFRAYNLDAYSLLAQNYPVDYPEPEAVIFLGVHQKRVLEVPVEMRERQAGSSSISGFKSFYYMAKVMLAMCVARIRPLAPLR